MANSKFANILAGGGILEDSAVRDLAVLFPHLIAAVAQIVPGRPTARIVPDALPWAVLGADGG
jgi:hypothetical protein